MNERRLPDLVAVVSAALVGSQGGMVERLTSVATATSDACEAERCWIVRIVDGWFVTLAGIKMVLADPRHPPLASDRGIMGRVARTMTTALVDDVLLDPDYVPAVLLTRSELAAPIFHAGEVVGVINLEANRVGAFGAGEQRVAEAVASLLGPHLRVL